MNGHPRNQIVASPGLRIAVPHAPLEAWPQPIRFARWSREPAAGAGYYLIRLRQQRPKTGDATRFGFVT